MFWVLFVQLVGLLVASQLLFCLMFVVCCLNFVYCSLDDLGLRCIVFNWTIVDLVVGWDHVGDC